MKTAFYCFIVILLTSLVISKVVNVAMCNPIPHPAIQMPYEHIHADISLVEDMIIANVTGIYTFINLDYENVTMRYPTPPDSTVKFVKIGNSSLDWWYTNETYLTYMGNYTVIKWFIEHVPETFNITVCYEHPLHLCRSQAVLGTYGFLYAMGTGKLLTNGYKETTAYVTITVDKNIVQGSISLHTVEWTGYMWIIMPADFNLTSEDEKWIVTATFQSEPLEPLKEDLLLTFIEGIPPDISDPIQNPAKNIQPNQTVNVLVNVSDIGIGVFNVTLWYTVDDRISWIPIPMNKTSWKTYQATIPGFEKGTCISYKIIAYDAAGNKAENNNNSLYYTYTVVPEYSFTTTLAILILSTILVIAFKKEGIFRGFLQPSLV